MSADEAAFALSMAVTFGALGLYALHLWRARAAPPAR